MLGDQVRFTSVFREHGAEPADLIEKVEVFTTERAAPAPRPVPVEPVEPVAPAAVEPERPRKLAVKAGSRPADADGAIAAALGRVAAKVATKAGAKSPVAEPPAPPAKVSAGKPGLSKSVVAKPEVPRHRSRPWPPRRRSRPPRR